MSEKISIDELDNVFEHKAPELINHLYVKIKNAGKAANLDDVQARQLASNVATEIARDFGGAVLYIPKGILLPLSGRDWQIWQEFNGKNHNDLALKYNVSVQWVYKIIKRVQQEEVAKRQGSLFAD